MSPASRYRRTAGPAGPRGAVVSCAAMKSASLTSAVCAGCFEMTQPSESYRDDCSKMVIQLEQPCRVTYRRRSSSVVEEGEERARLETTGLRGFETLAGARSSTTDSEGEVLAARCPSCGYTYDVARGDEHEGFAAGTAWADVPDSWCCPDCGVREKVDFVPVTSELESAS